MKPTDLFRPEVFQRREGAFYGVALSLDARPLRWLVVFGAVILLLLAVAICALPYTRKLRTVGITSPVGGVTRVVAPQAGIVTQIRTHDGDSVERGEALFEIGVDRQMVQSAYAAESEVNAISKKRAFMLAGDRDRQRANERQLGRLREKAEHYQVELRTLRDQLADQDSRIEIAVDQLRRDQALVQQNFLSGPSLDNRRDAVIDRKQRKSELERLIAASDRERTMVLGEIDDLYSKMVQSKYELQEKLQVLDQERLTSEIKRTLLVSATHTGIFHDLAVEEGNYVSAGQRVGTIMDPHTKFQVELFIPAESSATPKIGMNVTVSVRAFPFERYGLLRGTIIGISTVAVSGREFSHLPVRLQAEQLYFRATVGLSDIPSTIPGLDAGMPVDTVIKLEQKPLIYWLFRSTSHFVERTAL